MKSLLRISKLLFTPLAIAFLAYVIWSARDQLAEMFSEATLSSFLLAIAAWCVFNIATPLLAVTALRACGSKVDWRTAMSIHAARLPARYLPGGIWHTVGRIMDYGQGGVSSRHLTAFVALENGLAVSLALAFGGTVVFMMRGADAAGLAAAAASVAGIIALPIMWFVINSRVLRAPDRLTISSFMACAALMAMIWLFAIIAFLFYIDAFPSAVAGLTQFELAGVYLFSWGAGFLAVFAPQGIGVFEFVSGSLLQGARSFIGLAALMSAFRIVILIADVVVWVAYHVLRRAKPV